MVDTGQPTWTLPAPGAAGANQVVNLRTDPYGHLAVDLRAPTKGFLAVEGSYYTATNGQSGIATGATPTAFSATNPFITIFNTGNPNNTAAVRIVLDYITLIATAAGTAGASVQCAFVKDTLNRYTSGGTALTPVKTSTFGQPSVAQIYAGNITAAGASASAVTPVGNRYLKGAIPVAGDTYTLQFGSVDNLSNIAVSTVTFSSQGLPPICLNPGEMGLLHLWLPSQSAASSYIPEIGWSEW